jgi:GTP-binding protein LepA
VSVVSDGNRTIAVVSQRKGTTKTIESPLDFPDPSQISSGLLEVQEPMIRATIVVPEEFVGPVMELCSVCLNF